MDDMKLLRLLPVFLLSILPAFAIKPYVNSALTNTAVLVATPTNGQGNFLWHVNISNTNSSTVFVQFYDKATAGVVTVGTTAPYWVLAIPANSGVTDFDMTKALIFSNGIVIAATTTTTGGTAPSSNVTLSFTLE